MKTLFVLLASMIFFSLPADAHEERTPLFSASVMGIGLTVFGGLMPPHLELVEKVGLCGVVNAIGGQSDGMMGKLLGYIGAGSCAEDEDAEA